MSSDPFWPSSLLLSVKEPQDILSIQDKKAEQVAKDNERIKGNTFVRRGGCISSERKTRCHCCDPDGK